MKEFNFDSHLEKELDLIVKFTVFIRNSINGIKTKYGGDNIGYADVMGQKILSHIITAHDLLQGNQSEQTKIILQGKIDFSSVYVLLRSALETYLTFNYIFISVNSFEESAFRFNCWNLSSYTDRNRIKNTSAEYITFMEREVIEMNKLKSEIESSELYKQISNQDKKAILKGNWRANRSWAELGCIAGYTQKYISMQYNYLSWHVHASKSSILHINKSRKSDNNSDSLNLIYSIMLSILCKFNFDYINLMPELKHFSTDTKMFPLIRFWKETVELVD